MSVSLQEKLQKLKIDYIVSLPDKVKEIYSLAGQLRTKKWDQKKSDILINLVHRMVGSGKTFGVDRISEIAFILEKLLRAELNTDRVVSLAVEKKIIALLTQLTEIAVNATKDPPEKDEEINQKDKIKGGSGKEKKVFFFLNNQKISFLSDQFKLYGYSLIHCQSTAKLYNDTPVQNNDIMVFHIQSIENDKELLEKITKISEEKKEVHIVILSDDDTLKKRLIAVRCGADVFMTIPFDVPVLINKLNIMSQNRGSYPYHILIVDDDLDFVAWCAYTLQIEGMITSVVSKPEQVISQLIESRPELVLMDWHMPEYTGYDLASIIRQQDAFVSVPIVFLTTESNPEKRMKAMHIGADDFLLKPITADHLVEAVRIRAERYRTLRFYMERDSLTGLYNHSRIFEILVSELSRVRRYDNILSFAMIDIDFFKKINDTYGHLNGDRVLKDLANLLKERLRKNDLIGRYGGEEYAVIFPNTEPQAVVHVLNEVRESFAIMIHRAENRFFSVTFSAGVTSSAYHHDIQKLITSADKALYAAKSRGRNKIVLLET